MQSVAPPACTEPDADSAMLVAPRATSSLGKNITRSMSVDRLSSTREGFHSTIGSCSIQNQDLLASSVRSMLPELADNMTKEFHSSPYSPLPSTRASTMEEGSIEQHIEEVAHTREWDSGSFRFIKTIQEAPRNRGVVEQAEMRGYGLVAVKRMPISWTSFGDIHFRRKHTNETENPWIDAGVLKYLGQLGFSFVPKHLGMFSSASETFMVSSLATEGDLIGWMMGAANLPPPGVQREAAVWPVQEQLLLAVHYLHELSIAHCDLSCENILLTRDGRDGPLKVQIIDFCMASIDGHHISGVQGKIAYMAPELCLPAPCNPFPCDAFSLGVVMFVLAANSFPWSSTQPGGCKQFAYAQTHGVRALLQKRRWGKCPLLDLFAPGFTCLLEGLLAQRTTHRLSLVEVLQSKFMQE